MSKRSDELVAEWRAKYLQRRAQLERRKTRGASAKPPRKPPPHNAERVT